MGRRLILHDLQPEEAVNNLPREPGSVTLVYAKPQIHNCIGCFGCWIKTPGTCLIDDEGRSFGRLIPDCDEFIVVSKCIYGSLSPDVKLTLERSISVSLPFFHIVNGEMHHLPRYKKMPDLAYHFYGPDITEREKSTARKLTDANALNLYAPNHYVFFHSSMEGLKEALT